MLADYSNSNVSAGLLSGAIHVPDTFKRELIGFIANELPRWRDFPGRPNESSETALTGQLCAHLNGVARHSAGWDLLQFRTEVADEKHKGRKIDLVPSPCGVTLVVEGRNYSQFDTILPIECKRLPTPLAKDRDEREYVIVDPKSTGGIQRFKEGNHGAAHELAAMIAFIQSDNCSFWHHRIREWIEALVVMNTKNWTIQDFLVLLSTLEDVKIAQLQSVHSRTSGLPPIELRHLWIEMN